MGEGTKFFGAMFGWAILGSLVIGSLSRSLSQQALLLLAIPFVAGLLWFPAAATKGVRQANILVGYTAAVFGGIAVLAYLLVLLLGF